MFIATEPVVCGEDLALLRTTALDHLLEASVRALVELEASSAGVPRLAGELAALCRGLAELVDVLERPAAARSVPSSCVDLFLAALCCDRICDAVGGPSALVGRCSRRVGRAARSAAEALATQLRYELS